MIRIIQSCISKRRTTMSKTARTNYRRGPRGTRKAERHITVRSVRRDPPDLRKLSRAVIAMALRDADAQSEARAGMNDTAPAEGSGTASPNGAEASDD
jgi:hypothetical protein